MDLHWLMLIKSTVVHSLRHIFFVAYNFRWHSLQLVASRCCPGETKYILKHLVYFVLHVHVRVCVQPHNSFKSIKNTRMHSSRMRTARSSGRLLWGGGGLPQCMLGYPPGCGPGDTPPPVWAWRHPLGMGLETPPGQTPQLPPWVWAWRPARHARIPAPPGHLKGMLGYHLQCMLGYHPPPTLSTEFLTHTSENITLPQTSFADGNKGTNEVMEHHSHARTCFLHGVILLLIIFLCET